MKQITVKNPNNLPCIEHDKLTVLQGDLKTLSEENMGKLCHSIQKHGYFVPAFVWKSEGKHYILDATQRYHALSRMNEEGYDIPPIPYVEIEAEDKKDAAEKLLQITSRYGKIDRDTSFLTDFDLKLDDIEIAIPELDMEFEENNKEIIEDEISETPEKPISKTGDLWLCGKHRVLCGDCTKAEEVERLMDSKKADIVFTSPPYNANSHLTIFNKKKNKWESKNFYGNKNKERDNKSSDEYIAFNKKVFNIFERHIKKSANVFYNINYNKKSRSDYIEIVANAIDRGFNLFETVIWEKHGMPISDPQSMSRNYEFVFLFNMSEEYYTNFKIADYKTNLWKVSNRNAQDSDLKACFPVGLPSIAIENYSPLESIVVDVFLGSGSTLIAAEQLNRICYGMEIEPRYIDVILDRYAALTREDPMREDGMKWSELKLQNDTK